MPTTAPDDRLYVVVGVIRNENGELLMQQRPSGKDCAGRWEFPGGKLELGESPDQALARELAEELGIVIGDISPLMKLGYDYPHARVWLDVFLVTGFSGEATAVEGQVLDWLSISRIRELDLLDAVYPILDRLEQI